MDKGTIFCDLDGTLLKHGTFEWLPGAEQFLELTKTSNYRLVIMTRRGDQEFEGHHVYGEGPTLDWFIKAQAEDKFPYRTELLCNIRSPRILVDDSPLAMIERQTNQGFSDDDLVQIEAMLGDGHE
jgi:hypothetical protein